MKKPKSFKKCQFSIKNSTNLPKFPNQRSQVHEYLPNYAQDSNRKFFSSKTKEKNV